MSLLPGKFYLDDFFDDFSNTQGLTKMDLMKADIYEKGDKVHIEMDMPGFNKEDIKIQVEDGTIIVEAKKDESKEENEDKNYFRKERIYGSIKRQFKLGNINEDEISANFNNGVLDISFPKEEKKENKRFIEIN